MESRNLAYWKPERSWTREKSKEIPCKNRCSLSTFSMEMALPSAVLNVCVSDMYLFRSGRVGESRPQDQTLHQNQKGEKKRRPFVNTGEQAVGHRSPGIAQSERPVCLILFT